MNKLLQILENFPDEEFVILDGLDDAVIGVDTNNDPMRLVYSANDIVDCFVKEGMSEDDAIDNYEYNIARSLPHIPNAPIIIHTDFF